MRTVASLLLIGLVVWFVTRSGQYLVVDQPQHADAILVLAGETDRRPARALALQAQGYSPVIIVDVPDGARIYDRTQLEIARDWVNSLPQKNSMRLCATHGLSTKDESLEAGSCLDQAAARSVLLVTSDFHTRRAFSIFRKEFPARTFSVAAAADPTQFGLRWWQHRQWAKVNLDEWLRLFWWWVVDQWRPGHPAQIVMYGQVPR
jgi:uncharacterized SAM-binding protein YcdF (DUF218 family)